MIAMPSAWQAAAPGERRCSVGEDCWDWGYERPGAPVWSSWGNVGIVQGPEQPLCQELRSWDFQTAVQAEKPRGILRAGILVTVSQQKGGSPALLLCQADPSLRPADGAAAHRDAHCLWEWQCKEGVGAQPTSPCTDAPIDVLLLKYHLPPNQHPELSPPENICQDLHLLLPSPKHH